MTGAKIINSQNTNLATIDRSTNTACPLSLNGVVLFIKIPLTSRTFTYLSLRGAINETLEALRRIIFKPYFSDIILVNFSSLISNFGPHISN